MIRLGLIGCGTWGHRYIPAADETSNCRVVGISAPWRRSEEIDRYTRSLDRYLSWRMMADSSLDAFIVATPPTSHFEIVKHLLTLGRPVMVEKPFTLDWGSARRLATLAKGTNTPLLVNHQHLFAPAYEELRLRALHWSSIRTVSIGGGCGPIRDYSALWDYGPHDVSMFLGLAHKPWQTSIRATSSSGEREFRLQLETETVSGRVFNWNNGTGKVRSFVALNPNGELLSYDDCDNDARLTVNGRAYPISPMKPLTCSLRAFARVCETGQRDWRFDPDLAVETVRVIEQAHMTAERR